MFKYSLIIIMIKINMVTALQIVTTTEWNEPIKTPHWPMISPDPLVTAWPWGRQLSQKMTSCKELKALTNKCLLKRKQLHVYGNLVNCPEIMIFHHYLNPYNGLQLKAPFPSSVLLRSFPTHSLKKNLVLHRFSNISK